MAGVWALAGVPSLLRSQPLFIVLLEVALCGVVAIGWWPPPEVTEE